MLSWISADEVEIVWELKILPEYLKILCGDTKLFADHSLATCHFVKDKVMVFCFVEFFFFSLESQMYLPGYHKIKMLERVFWSKSFFISNTHNFRLTVCFASRKQVDKICLNLLLCTGTQYKTQSVYF